MSVNADTSRPTGYAWPGADEGEVNAMCARIARQLARAGARSIGVLPLTGNPSAKPGRKQAGRPPFDMAPLLERLGAALASFMGGTVAFIGPRSGWGTAGGDDDESAPTARMRQLRPQVIEIVPPRSGDGRLAVMALEHAITSLPGSISCVLVDLSGYTSPGRVPDVVRTVDKVVLAVVGRVTRKAWAAEVAAKLPEGKSLGAILIG